MKFQVACHLCGWPAEARDDRTRMFEIISQAGYDGVEGIVAQSADELVALASQAAEFGLKLVNVGGPTLEDKIRFNATLGLDAMEIPAARPHPPEMTDADYGRAADELADPIAKTVKLGLKPFHHIHVGTVLETVADCREMLARVPDLWLLFDTGHLRAAGDDPMNVLEEFPDQIGHVHLKNLYASDTSGWDHRAEGFWQKNHFCDLADGNTGIDIGAILNGLRDAGYTGWVSVEEDHPRRPIADVVRDNRAFMRELGF